MRYTVIVESTDGETEFTCECETLEAAQAELLEQYNHDCMALGLSTRNKFLPTFRRYRTPYTTGEIIDNEA